MRPGLSRQILYVEKGIVHAALVVHVEPQHANLDNDDRINLIFWNKFGEQHFRKDVPWTAEPDKKDCAWFWPQVPHMTAAQIMAQGEEFRKHMLANNDKNLKDGRITKEQHAAVIKQLEASKNPPAIRPPVKPQ
jgi:hypothetical protein